MSCWKLPQILALIAAACFVAPGCQPAETTSGGGGGTAASSGSSDDGGSSSESDEGDASETDGSGDTAAAPPLEGWGSLTGKFVFAGDPAAPAKLTITKDQEYCGEHDLVDESLVVGEEGKGVANVVVHLYVGRNDAAPEAHPDYAEAAAAEVLLDNKNCRFEPHVCFVQPGQTLKIGNSDSVAHNTKIDSVVNPAMNQTLPPEQTIEQTFQRPESKPAKVSCSIHPWMSGYVAVRDTPYGVVTGEDGTFEIKNLPAGEWTFQVWHESLDVNKVQVDGESATWSRGRFTATIQPDATEDLGELALGG